MTVLNIIGLVLQLILFAIMAVVGMAIVIGLLRGGGNPVADYERAINDPNDPMHGFAVYDMLEYLHETDPSEFPFTHHGD